MKLFIIVSYDLLYVFDASCNCFFFISDLIVFGLLPFFDGSGQNLSILLIFSKNQLLVSSIIPILFFISISFISALIFMIFFLLLTLGIISSSSFRCKVRFFTCNFSYFLRYYFITIHFHLRTAFATSHRFWVMCLHFHLYLCIFFISSLISSVIHQLFSSRLFSLHVCVCLFTHFSCSLFLIS